MAQQQELSILEFQARYGTEDACREHLFHHKWPYGFVCEKCGGTDYYTISSRNTYECRSCGYQASVTSGTVMHKTHTPLMLWFWAIYLVSRDKRGLSALALSKQIGVSYQTAWLILHKIREAMSLRDDNYKLANLVELDDGFFGTPGTGGKRGRGTSKSKVVVGISVHQDKPQFAKMEVVNAIDSDSLKQIAQDNIEAGATIKSDGYRSYNILGESGYQHVPIVINDQDASKVLHWVHILISNAKAFIDGTFHGLGKKHFQRYLDEFCYRFNRRFWETQLFDRLLNACCCAKTITYSELTHTSLS
jgi:transposase-like protein